MTPWLGLACGPKLEALLDFATHSQTTEGFGYLLADRSVDASRGVETWINARMTHVFSLGCLAGRPTHLLAEHGIKALQQTLLDHTHGGWFSDNTYKPVKAAYEHAFVLLAASTAALAGIDGAGRLLRDALAIWRDRFWDQRARMAVEEWDASWSHLDDYRGANSNMHGVEAMLAASDALRLTGGTDSAVAVDLIHDAAAVIRRIVHGEARSRSWRLPEHYTNTWSVDVGFNEHHQADPFRPFGVTVGHQFEWARLALHCAHALDDQAPRWLLTDARHLYEAAKTRGGRRRTRIQLHPRLG